METLWQYLNKLGLLEREATGEELAEAKRQYRKIYQKDYQKQFRRNHVRKDLFLTKKEHAQLSAVAKQHKGRKSVARLCKELAFAYLDNHYVLPDDAQVRQLELYLRGATNNLNQLVRYVHRQKAFSLHELDILRCQVNEMEERISKALRHPSTLQGYLKKLVQEKPELLTTIRDILNSYLPQ